MNNLIAGLVVVVGVLGGFYGGAKYGQSHPSASSVSGSPSPATSGAGAGAGNRAGAGGGGFGAGAGAGGGQATAGQITAVDGNTITVRDRQSGKDVKVNVSNARITKTVQGTTADLTQNQGVTVTGSTGSDGVVSAQTVIVGNATGGFGGGRARPSPSP